MKYRIEIDRRSHSGYIFTEMYEGRKFVIDAAIFKTPIPHTYEVYNNDVRSLKIGSFDEEEKAIQFAIDHLYEKVDVFEGALFRVVRMAEAKANAVSVYMGIKIDYFGYKLAQSISLSRFKSGSLGQRSYVSINGEELVLNGSRA